MGMLRLPNTQASTASEMPLEQLRPTAKPRVIDLVAQSGFDVGPWALRSDGTPVVNPGANPAYCYEWCFEDEQRVLFSLWFDHMRAEEGRVLQRVNMRDLRRRVEHARQLDNGTKTAIVRRAIAVDSAVQRAFREKLPVRVIICDGNRHNVEDLTTGDPSKVERRLLDPSPWRVVEYDYLGVSTGGAAVIVRDELLD